MLSRFWAALDSESVKLYQAIMFTCLWMWGLYAATVATKPESVSEIMGPVVYAIWIGVFLIMPVVCAIAYRCWQRGRVPYGALWTITACDFAIAVNIAAYILSIASHYNFGTGTPGLFGFSALLIMTILFTVRDVRRIVQVERLAPYMPGGKFDATGSC